MLFKELKKSLQDKIYYCYALSPGKDKEDLYLKSSCVTNITSRVLGQVVDFNLQVFTNETLNVNSLKIALNTLPFLSEKRLIVIKENETIKNKELLSFLKEYLLNPVETSVLIIDMCEGSGFEEIKTTENVCLVDCSRVEKSILESFILKRCKDNKISIGMETIDKLIDFTDGYMSKIDIELDKLISFKFNEKVITCEDVVNNVTKSDEYQIFELTNSLFNKNAEKALFIVDDIIKNKKNISGILSLIYVQIRRSFFAKICKEEPQEVAKKLEIKEFAVKKLKELTCDVSAKRLKEMLVLCKNIDYKVKSGKMELITGIYNLVFSILILV